MELELKDLFNMLIALASGLGIGKLLEKRQTSADDNLKFLQAEISQANQQWRADLKALIEANHEEVVGELKQLRRKGNQILSETGKHRGNDAR